jgi:EmrB/QacA subfamily drug resistance transporter
MAAVILGSGIVFLDSTVVNVALPKIGQDLPSHLLGVLEGQSYVYNAYLLSLSSLLILAGALNDYYGRRRMFTLGLVGFGVTSVACGLAPNLELLILFRILQGAAGALLVPGSLSIITATFAGEEQGRAFGLWAGASAATTILGPVVGGILVDAVSWRMAFFINLPLVVLALYATNRHVPETRDEESTGHFDWLGAVVIALAVGGLAFGTIRGQQREWHDPAAFIALGVGAVAAVAFPFLMARSSHPLVPLSLFRSRNFAVTNISTLVIYGALYVTFYFMTIFLQGTLGYNATAAGFAGIWGTLLLTVFSSRFGTLAARYGPRVFMAVGPAIMAVGVWSFTRIPASSGAWILGFGSGQHVVPPRDYFVHLFPGYLIFGVGITIMVAPLTTALMTSVPKHRAGVASAINNAISRVGPQLAGALIFVAIAASFYSGMASRVPGLDTTSTQVRQQFAPLNQPASGTPLDEVTAAREASAHSFHLAMTIAAAMLLAGAGVNAIGIRNHVRAAEAPATAEPQAASVAAATETEPGGPFGPVHHVPVRLRPRPPSSSRGP